MNWDQWQRAQLHHKPGQLQPRRRLPQAMTATSGRRWHVSRRSLQLSSGKRIWKPRMLAYATRDGTLLEIRQASAVPGGAAGIGRGKILEAAVACTVTGWNEE